MSRPIEFRGKRVDNGVMVEGFYSYLFNEETGKEEGTIVFQLFDGASVDYPHPCVTTVYAEVDPKTIGQFTGLLDKNGTKIFEGDIFMNGESVRVIEIYDGNTHAITPDRTRSILLSFIVGNKSNTVIGNIHENKDLLK